MWGTERMWGTGIHTDSRLTQPQQPLPGLISTVPKIIRSSVAICVLLDDDAIVPIFDELTLDIRPYLYPEDLLLGCITQEKHLIERVTNTLLS